MIQVCAFLLFSIHSYALESSGSVPNVAVTTDAWPGTEYLTIERDSHGVIDSMVYTHVDLSSVSYDLEQLRQAPQLVETYNGHKVTYISVESDFNALTGGHANVRYMSNGMNGTYKNFRVLLTVGAAPKGAITLKSDPNLNDPESDKNTYNSEFNRLFMKRTSFLGQTIGIEKVIPSYEQPTY